MKVIKINPENRKAYSHRQRDPFYQSKQWRTFRESHFKEFPFCVDCASEGVEKLAVILDHIHQRSLGGVDFPDRSGLRGLCRHHDAVRQAEQSKRAR